MAFFYKLQTKSYADSAPVVSAETVAKTLEEKGLKAAYEQLPPLPEKTLFYDEDNYVYSLVEFFQSKPRIQPADDDWRKEKIIEGKFVDWFWTSPPDANSDFDTNVRKKWFESEERKNTVRKIAKKKKPNELNWLTATNLVSHINIRIKTYPEDYRVVPELHYNDLLMVYGVAENISVEAQIKALATELEISVGVLAKVNRMPSGKGVGFPTKSFLQENYGAAYKAGETLDKKENVADVLERIQARVFATTIIRAETVQRFYAFVAGALGDEWDTLKESISGGNVFTKNTVKMVWEKFKEKHAALDDDALGAAQGRRSGTTRSRVPKKLKTPSISFDKLTKPDGVWQTRTEFTKALAELTDEGGGDANKFFWSLREKLGPKSYEEFLTQFKNKELLAKGTKPMVRDVVRLACKKSNDRQRCLKKNDFEFSLGRRGTTESAFRKMLEKIFAPPASDTVYGTIEHPISLDSSSLSSTQSSWDDDARKQARYAKTERMIQEEREKMDRILRGEPSDSDSVSSSQDGSETEPAPSVDSDAPQQRDGDMDEVLFNEYSVDSEDEVAQPDSDSDRLQDSDLEVESPVSNPFERSSFQNDLLDSEDEQPRRREKRPQSSDEASQPDSRDTGQKRLKTSFKMVIPAITPSSITATRRPEIAKMQTLFDNINSLFIDPAEAVLAFNNTMDKYLVDNENMELKKSLEDQFVKIQLLDDYIRSFHKIFKRAMLLKGAEDMRATLHEKVVKTVCKRLVDDCLNYDAFVVGNKFENLAYPGTTEKRLQIALQESELDAEALRRSMARMSLGERLTIVS